MRQRLKGFRDLISLHLAVQAEREAAQAQAALQAEIAALDAKLAGARSGLEAAEESLARLQSDKRTAESEVQRLEQLKSKYRTQLMEAKTNEVYKTLLHEIETTGQAISSKETTVLEVMEAIDAARAVGDAARSELAAAERINVVEAGRLGARIQALEQERQAAAARAAGYEPKVPGDLLARHRRIADARGGKGLARATAAGCGECHVAVRPQVLVQLIAREDLYYCPGCGRILFRDENLREDDGEQTVGADDAAAGHRTAASSEDPSAVSAG